MLRVWRKAPIYRASGKRSLRRSDREEWHRIIVILDGLTISDMGLYRNILDKVGECDRAADLFAVTRTLKTGIRFFYFAEYILSRIWRICADQIRVLEKLHGEDKAIMEAILAIANETTPDLDTYYVKLFTWCQGKLRGIE